MNTSENLAAIPTDLNNDSPVLRTERPVVGYKKPTFHAQPAESVMTRPGDVYAEASHSYCCSSSYSSADVAIY